MQSKIYVSDNNDFKVLDLRKEYKNYSDDIPFAIVTDMDEENLIDEYGDVLDTFYPYVILSTKMYQAMRESFLNDDRERKRDILFHDAFAIDVDSFLIDELSNPVRICESLFTMNAIFAEMEKLPERAGFFIYQKYIVGYSSREIAEQEGITKWAVWKSILRAKPAVLRIFVEQGVAA